MKARIRKIMMLATVLIFASAGVSLAHDVKAGYHRPPGNAYGHYQGKGHSTPPRGHYQRNPHYRERYVYKEVHEYHHNDRDPYPPRSGVSFRISVFDPNFAFSVGVKQQR